MTATATLETTSRRRLVAELVVLEDYDRLRQGLGYDFGCGQRGRELSLRYRELGSSLHARDWPADIAAEDLTREELVDAFERVGEARLRRAERDAAAYGTRASRRTLDAWRRIAASLAAGTEASS